MAETEQVTKTEQNGEREEERNYVRKREEEKRKNGKGQIDRERNESVL